MDFPDALKEKLAALPAGPGVYLMRDRHGKVIYVGKAKSLRSRVRSYFQPSTLAKADPKTRGLIRSIRDLEVVELRTEAEATVTEGRLIHDYRPRFNVDQPDDKAFVRLRVDVRQPFPRIEVCRTERNDGARYFGPYVSAASARVAAEFCEKRFGLRVCRPRVPGPADHRHCLNDIIRFCSAPCIGRVDEAAYRDRVDEAMAFLAGRRPDCLEELEREMEEASADRRFERAAELRDTLHMLRMALRRPPRVTRAPDLRRDAARQGLAELQGRLGLTRPPGWIEGFDISHISGTYTVASMVVAIDGIPDPRRYRIFRIRRVEGVDDPASIAEAVSRRYRRLWDEEGRLPDLVLIDGGVTQLKAALAARDGLGLPRPLPMAGLAKRFEELFPEGRMDAVLRLPPDSEGLLVLRRLRDEAHRFAITHHRRLRRKSASGSELDDIPGIGGKRKAILLTRFGSLRRLKRATLEEIAEIPGFGPRSAEILLDSLQEGAHSST